MKKIDNNLWDESGSPIPVVGPGYHLKEIKKGVLGEVSKIREEVEELQDAMDQGVSIMALVELSDLYGAIQVFLENNFPGTTMQDLQKMNAVTARAFKHGYRK